MEVRKMEDILKNKELVYIFREFVHEQYNSENFSFWLEVECYKRLSDANRPTRAQEMFNKYFDPNSKDEINVEARFEHKYDFLKKATKNLFLKKTQKSGRRKTKNCEQRPL